ncbi:MAG: Fpg/Nei family DNA glycosylase [Herpetosiphonaceae bacterium]|nr:Fpg/Nei family DNA glycosylase [Herpetosiphonaceae bacterium]
MPEGPTIRVTGDTLRRVLQDQRIEHFESQFKKAKAEDWAGKVQGQLVRCVRVHGKNLFFDLENDWTLYTHMLMWGSWHVYGKTEPWLKEKRKARIVIETATHVVVLFSAPKADLIHASALAQHQTSELGPDLLKDDWQERDMHEAWQRLHVASETPLGTAIMDQTIVAGIGNILKSEILFKTRLHPLRHSGSLSHDEFLQLIDVSRRLMQLAYTTQGFKEVFLPPSLQQATGKLGYVYGRSGQPCFNCGTSIQMVRQGPLERMTFFCPHCQPFDPANPPPLKELTMQPLYANSVHTLEEARDFVLAMGMIGILQDTKGKLPTLWDAVDFLDKQPGEGGWGEKMGKVWSWKNALPATYPDEIFYGKIKGGRAVLMSMEKLRALYQQYHKPVEQCGAVAQQLWKIIQQGSIMTVPLRQVIGMTDRKERGLFDRALQELQVTFNIARSNQPDVEGDIWVPFTKQYPQFAEHLVHADQTPAR